MITAKVKVASHQSQGSNPDANVLVTFGADYADDRNKEWARATPYLNLQMVVKPEVAALMPTDQCFTLTFEADEELEVTMAGEGESIEDTGQAVGEARY